MIISAYISGFLIGFENTSYTVNEEGEFGFVALEVCVRMFEPSDDTPVGTLFRIGVETVQGTAGIVCAEMHTTLLSIAFCLVHRWR